MRQNKVANRAHIEFAYAAIVLLEQAILGESMNSLSPVEKIRVMSEMGLAHASPQEEAGNLTVTLWDNAFDNVEELVTQAVENRNDVVKELFPNQLIIERKAPQSQPGE